MNKHSPSAIFPEASYPKRRSQTYQDEVDAALKLKIPFTPKLR